MASDDGGGRPLLEDDGLEDDYEETNHQPAEEHYPPLYVDPRVRNTNPFLNQDLTPKISPAETHTRHGAIWSPPVNERRDTMIRYVLKIGENEANAPFRNDIPPDPRFGAPYAPATLPRQVTPLAAVPKPLAPPKPLTGPVVFVSATVNILY